VIVARIGYAEVDDVGFVGTAMVTVEELAMDDSLVAVTVG
jgi:hypothetical protein